MKRRGLIRWQAVALLLLPLSALLAAGCSASEEEGTNGADTTATVSPDTVGADPAARSDPYYVHLAPGTDPAEVARRHGLEPIQVIREPRPGLYVRLTPSQREELLADSTVQELAREIHGGEGADSLPRVRGIGGPRDTSPDTSGGRWRPGA